jgi:hypothetical protein
MTVRILAIALFIGIAPAAAGAEPLGRLFHSPAERSALDSLRKARLQPQKPAAPRPSAEPQSARLDGYVVRSDGRSTLWVNGSAISNAR